MNKDESISTAAAEREKAGGVGKISMPASLMAQEFANYHRRGYKAGSVAEREAVLALVDEYAKDNTDLRDAILARGQA
jgi:hypothetical protein